MTFLLNMLYAVSCRVACVARGRVTKTKKLKTLKKCYCFRRNLNAKRGTEFGNLSLEFLHPYVYFHLFFFFKFLSSFLFLYYKKTVFFVVFFFSLNKSKNSIYTITYNSQVCLCLTPLWPYRNRPSNHIGRSLSFVFHSFVMWYCSVIVCGCCE